MPFAIILVASVLIATVVAGVSKFMETSSSATVVVERTISSPYELVRECKPPFMRRVQERILKDKEGQLWLVDSHGKVKIAEGVKLNEICKKAGGLF